MRPTLPLLAIAPAIALAVAASVPLAAASPTPVASQRMARPDAPVTLSYGSDDLQTGDYWRGATPDAPLVVFVHGGGWKRGDKQMMRGSAKLEHWQALGYAVASVNYRLVPDNTVEDEASDVAAALALLHDQAGRLGFDAERIALVGHSAGAHLVALVGTDPQWLRTVGLDLTDIAGVVPLDGAAYDVAYQLEHAGRLMRGTYQQAFGDDPVRHRTLSPTFHAAAPNAPQFLILHVQRADAEVQSEALAKALREGGTPAELHGLSGRGLRGHMQINRELGEADYPATAIVDRFLARVFS